jgi:hypothetical protein
MHVPSSRNVLVAVFAMALLLVGTAVVLGSLFLLALSLGMLNEPKEAAVATGMYYRVIIAKGLAPQLLLTLIFHPLLRRWLERSRGTQSPVPSGEWVRLALLAVSSALAYCVVAPFLLTVEMPMWPALQMKSLGNHAGSFFGMTGATTLCAWLPEALAPLRTHASAPDDET